MHRRPEWHLYSLPGPYIAKVADFAKPAFERFPPGHKREYVEWITEAKREETRNRRLQIALRQIVEGKPQNWKYMK